MATVSDKKTINTLTELWGNTTYFWQVRGSNDIYPLYTLLHGGYSDFNHGQFISVDGYSNKGYLRAGGLTEGKTFEINGVYSEDALNRFVSDMKMIVVEVYKKFMKPIKINCLLTTESVI